MMKVYKAVTTNDLEIFTRDGWQIERVEKEARAVEHSLYVDASTGPNGQYINGHYKRNVSFGDVLIFIVWKDQEKLDREEELSRNVAQLTDKLNAQAEQTKKTAENIAALTKAEKDQRDYATYHMNQAKTEGELRRKLEGDIAKLRNALGERQMKEIIG